MKDLMVKQGEIMENYSSVERDDRMSTAGYRQVFNNNPVGFQFNRNLNTE